MSRRLRISRPPSTGDRSLDFWTEQLTDAINQLSLGPAFAGLSVFSGGDGQNVNDDFSHLTQYDKVMPDQDMTSDLTNEYLEVTSEGTYKISASISFESDTNNAQYEFALFSAASRSSFFAETAIGSAGDIASMSIDGILSLRSDHTVALHARRLDSAATASVILKDAQLTAHRID